MLGWRIRSCSLRAWRQDPPFWTSWTASCWGDQHPVAFLTDHPSYLIHLSESLREHCEMSWLQIAGLV